MLPNPDILNDYPYGKFVLSNLAAKRAEQLSKGAIPLVQIESRHYLTIALAEIAAGKIKPILPHLDGSQAVEPTDVSVLVGETVPAEMGLLLPSLDEVDGAGLAGFLTDEEDHEEPIEIEEGLSLSALIGEEGDEPEAAASDEDALSLDDLAEKETLADEEADEA